MKVWWQTEASSALCQWPTHARFLLCIRGSYTPLLVKGQTMLCPWVAAGPPDEIKMMRDLHFLSCVFLYGWVKTVFVQGLPHLVNVIANSTCTHHCTSKIKIIVTIYIIDKQEGPTVQHRELYSIFYNNLDGKRIWKRMDICMCITESLCCTPETNTRL